IAGHPPASDHGDDLFRAEPDARRRVAGRFCRVGAWRHCRRREDHARALDMSEALALHGPILRATQVTKRCGGFTAVDALDFTLAERERVGLIGPNGSGKSTFVNALTGVFGIDQGSVEFNGADITLLPAWQRARLGLARSFQIPRPFKSQTVRENIEVPLMFA